MTVSSQNAFFKMFCVLTLSVFQKLISFSLVMNFNNIIKTFTKLDYIYLYIYFFLNSCLLCYSAWNI